jgi:hemoglobin/transferrin/lactoferrin receptor protein
VRNEARRICEEVGAGSYTIQKVTTIVSELARNIVSSGDGTLPGSEFQTWSGLLKGTMYLDEGEVLRLSYQRWNSDSNDQPYAATGTVIPPVVGGSQDFGTVDRKVDDQTAVLSYENSAPDNDMLDLKAQLSFSDTAVAQGDASYGFQSPSTNFFEADYGYRTLQANVQNTSTFQGEDWENFLTYGIQASHQTRTADPVLGTVITTHPEGTATSLGVFAQTEHTINDAFTVIAGARGDYSYLDPSDALATTTPNGQFGFSPKLAALYKFNENFNVFGSAAHTERMPTLDEMFQYQGTRTANLSLKKEASDNFEVGFGLQGFDLLTEGDSVGFKATAFYNNITDGIRSNPVTSNAPYFVNIAGMRLYGLELEGSYESEMMFARLAYTLTRGEYTQTFVGSSAANTRYAGDPVDSLPQDKIVATLGGRLPEHNLEYGTKVTLAAEPIVAVATVPVTAKPGGWASVDVFASWKPDHGPLEGLEAQFAVENIFNADYRENLSMDRSKGRTFKLTLARQFDY